jgi:CRISPR/Cas system CSM-associated protein Csm2 small subunit
MEQIIAFVLGIVIVALPIAVVVMFKTKSQVKNLYKEVEDLQYVINDIETETGKNEDQLDRRIDQEIDRADKQIEELYKYVDSRTDKMESRCDSKFNENSIFADLIQHAIEKLQHQVSEVQVTLENELNKQ